MFAFYICLSANRNFSNSNSYKSDLQGKRYASFYKRGEGMGLFWGLIGVFIFSLTLPATKFTVGYLDPIFVGLGRAVVAGTLALLTLYVTGSPILPTRLLPRLLVVSLGVVVGFPVFSAYAMQSVPSSHGGVITGILPLATAAAGVWIAKESQTILFWISGAFGSTLVVLYSIWNGEIDLKTGDIFLLLAVLSASIGYAEGGRLSKEHGGWKVISWSLVISLPISVLASAFTFPTDWLRTPASAWMGFLYTAVFSMFLGFFAWYKGLAMSGIGKVGQIQLIQPFLTFLFSSFLLSERIDSLTLLAGFLVSTTIFIGRIRLRPSGKTKNQKEIE
ncbi:DMT family transporter [Leptospira gomenensis]|uniref:DMT family transporter n=1 Tax=Leptospira gomenensis TaxID=2484974 RepID=UPI0014382B7C|nr:DMT family transporter [Leptospira gomenensis]